MNVRVNRSFAPCARLNLYHSIRTLSAISIDDRRRVRWSCITTFGLLLELLQINPCCKEQSLLLFDVWIPRVELYTSASRHLVSAYTLPSFPASSRGIRTSNSKYLLKFFWCINISLLKQQVNILWHRDI